MEYVTSHTSGVEMTLIERASVCFGKEWLFCSSSEGWTVMAGRLPDGAIVARTVSWPEMLESGRFSSLSNVTLSRTFATNRSGGRVYLCYWHSVLGQMSNRSDDTRWRKIVHSCIICLGVSGMLLKITTLIYGTISIGQSFCQEKQSCKRRTIKSKRVYLR